MSHSAHNEEHVRKRRRLSDPKQRTPEKDIAEDLTADQDFWSNQDFFAIDAVVLGLLGDSTEDAQTDFFFSQDDTDVSSWNLELADLPFDNTSNRSHQDAITDVLFPALPSKADRRVDLDLLNPFAKHAKERYGKPRLVVIKANKGDVNGYIKFRIQPSASEGISRPHSLFSRGFTTPRPVPIEHRLLPHETIPLLPPDFGRGLKLDPDDSRLFTFYLIAYCQGRTFLTKTNYWLSEIAAMAVSEPGVKHGILALAGSYVLDYVRSDTLKRRTDDHYARVSEFISEALPRLEHHAIEKSDALVGAISLLVADDEVNWELRRPKTEIPNFYRGALLAKAILDHSDPGYRYWKTDNVQCSKAWTGNANYVAHVCILTEIMSPLKPMIMLLNDRNFSWLLWGSKQEVHTIHGVTGLSPKLLHIFAQITRLCYQLEGNFSSIFINLAAIKIQKILETFRQRSELSEGYPTVAALKASCELDENGKVTSATKITELTGECWVCAAKIYLQCRFFRKPLRHPDVQFWLDTLICLVKRMPWEGQLFTAQSPFFPIFLMAITSTRPEDRAVGGDWFENTVQDSRGRSSVPPVWTAVKLLWTWVDNNMTDFSVDDWQENKPLHDREAWWEAMTTYLINNVGWMSLT